MTARSPRRLQTLALCALAAMPTAINGQTSAAKRPAVISAAGAGPVSAAEAQTRVDFVVYLPTYLPPGTGQPRLFFAPEQEFAGGYVPNRIYADYGEDVTLWQMPTLGRPLRYPGHPMPLAGKLGWLSSGPGRNAFTFEWEQGGTQLGLSGPTGSQDEVMKMVGSAAQAAPNVAPEAPSPARLHNWFPTPEPGPPPGGIGISLAPGTPPMVLSLDPGTPAAKGGIQPGDIITAVEGQTVSGQPVAKIMGMVRGQPGTAVRLLVQRHGQPAPLQMSLRRQVLPVLDAKEATVAQARSIAPFALLQPHQLPRGYRLVTCTVITRSGKPVEVRLIYMASPLPPLVISETDARAHRIVVPGSGLTQRVSIGDLTGTLNTGSSLVLTWAQGGTSVLLQSRSFPVRGALAMARSMK